MDDSNIGMIFAFITLVCLLGFFLLGSWVWLVIGALVIFVIQHLKRNGQAISVVVGEQKDSFSPVNLVWNNLKEDARNAAKPENAASKPTPPESASSEEAHAHPREDVSADQHPEDANAVPPDDVNVFPLEDTPIKTTIEIPKDNRLYAEISPPGDINLRSFIPSVGMKNPSAESMNKFIEVAASSGVGRKKSTLNDRFL